MEEDAGLRFEQNTFGALFGSADKSEGMKAFLEKREAKWQHK
jgi:enoyl-CoA hydratase/carnithine racemase